MFRIHLVVWKFDQVRLESETHNPSGLAFAAHFVNTLHKFTKRQLSFPAMGFHTLKYMPGERGIAMGCSPHSLFPFCILEHKRQGTQRAKVFSKKWCCPEQKICQQLRVRCRHVFELLIGSTITLQVTAGCIWLSPFERGSSSLSLAS